MLAGPDALPGKEGRHLAGRGLLVHGDRLHRARMPARRAGRRGRDIARTSVRGGVLRRVSRGPDAAAERTPRGRIDARHRPGTFGGAGSLPPGT